MAATANNRYRRDQRRGDPARRPSVPVGLASPVVAVLLLVASLLLQSLLFPPIDLWPLAFVCLVPWFFYLGTAQEPKLAYLASYLLGLAFFLINLHWMAIVTVEGYVALAAYLAVYYPLVACPVRHAIRRRGLPLALVAPAVWVASELARAVVITGFPWLFLGHTQYKVLTLIQISDLVGAYGVTFLVAAINGALADLALQRWAGHGSALRASRRTRRVGLIFAAALLLATCIYGQVQLRRNTTSPGPKVAVLQQDYLNYTDPEVSDLQPTPRERAEAYDRIIDQAAAERPDLFLLPETPWFMALNAEHLADPSTRYDSISPWSCRMLQGHAVESQAYLVTGGMAVIPTPFNVRADDIKHNSAYVFAPDPAAPGPQRYDKVHCVYFGETVPFRYGRLRFLYWWFNDRMPFGRDGYEYSLTPGREFKVFAMTARSVPGRQFRFAVPICYEDVMPYVSRRFVIDPETGGKRADFLLNISNDGWFGHTNEHPQHLAICAFRAVENRVPIARAVNTGISGFIDSNGRIHDLVTVTGRSRGPGVTGYSVATLRVDSRHSLYTRTSDVFALACLLLTGLVYVDHAIIRRTRLFGRSPESDETA